MGDILPVSQMQCSTSILHAPDLMRPEHVQTRIEDPRPYTSLYSGLNSPLAILPARVFAPPARLVTPTRRPLAPHLCTRIQVSRYGR